MSLGWFQKLLDAVGSVVPIERWIRALTNVLRTLGLAFILCFVLVTLLLVNDWGFSSQQRAVFIYVLFGMMLVSLAIILVLAIQRGDLLFSPYERSLQKGKQYGTEREPKTRQEALSERPDPPLPRLPGGGDSPPKIGGRR